MSSSLSSQLRSHPLLLGVGVALGVGVSLVASHLLQNWCPIAGTVSRQQGCPFSSGHGRSSKARKAPVVVTVTGAAGQIGYAIVFQIAQGRMLGADQPVELRLHDLDVEAIQRTLQGVAMELADCAFPLVSKVVCTSQLQEAFQDCDYALLIGAKPRGKGMERADLLKQNADIFKKQGAALNAFARRTVKVLVVGNPANTNAKIAMEHAPNLPSTAFSAMTKLDQIRAVAQLASKTNVGVDDIRNVVVWGNHSDTQYPDITFATIRDASTGQERPAAEMVPADWARGEFIKTVQGRGGVIINAMQKSSAASAANAAIEHVRAWALGTAPGEYTSMAVCSQGEYGVPRGLIFSFPVTCSNGEYTIVPGLESRISEFGREKMRLSWMQLQEEDQLWRGAGGPAAAEEKKA